jgi:hypothetical protein
MSFKLTLCSQGEGTLCDILFDIITSAAYFGERDVGIEYNLSYLRFVFQGDFPDEYVRYLNKRYNLSIGVN